jgi:hypothetical protein
MTSQSLEKLFWYLVRENDGEPLAQYIESGGDLSGVTNDEREILARLVRGQKPRKRGQKLEKGLEERNWQICLEVVCLKAYGLPAYTGSGAVNHKPSLATDACSVVNERWELSEGTVQKIWDKRDSLIRQFEAMYKGQKVESQPLPQSSTRERDKWIERMCNAWRETD